MRARLWGPQAHLDAGGDMRAGGRPGRRGDRASAGSWDPRDTGEMGQHGGQAGPLRVKCELGIRLRVKPGTSWQPDGLCHLSRPFLRSDSPEAPVRELGRAGPPVASVSFLKGVEGGGKRQRGKGRRAGEAAARTPCSSAAWPGPQSYLAQSIVCFGLTILK